MAYDIAPAHPITPGQIEAGFGALAAHIQAACRQGRKVIALDGYVGVHWDSLRAELSACLQERSDSATNSRGPHLQGHLGTLHGRPPTEFGPALAWVETSAFLLPEPDILERLRPNLGGDDPIFGKLYEGILADFFDLPAGRAAVTGQPGPLIVAGPGAALFCQGLDPLLIYVDLPKDEIQARMRAGTVTNLGAAVPESPGAMYKRFYFIDWPVLNRHKATLLPNIDWFVDAQIPGRPTLISGPALRRALAERARSYFRVRPWFFPGVWGGQYMKRHFRGLPQDVPNYAWSFELIVPENGLVFASGAERLECSFDLIMFQGSREVLGPEAAARFGHNFPIRFDYLDTIDGDNLSLQCHPRPEYIKERFGEPFTQDESYYITACKPGARVYLGLRDGADLDRFRTDLLESQRTGISIDADRYVYSLPSQPHDLFLIPNGTIHGSGVDNLVLEISATPYIYTFKIYDWVRPDLNGKPRPLNVDRAWENLYFDRRERYVHDRLCPRPVLLRSGEGWREQFIGSHEALFYAVHRYEFERPIAAETAGRCHILNVVEGDGVTLETAVGERADFHFLETFVVPAAAGSYRLIPHGSGTVKVVFAFVK